MTCNKGCNKKLNVLIVSSEVAPYIKSGGLGDVAGSLPYELKAKGIDVRVCFPKYRDVEYKYIKDLKHITTVKTAIGWRNPEAEIYSFEDGVKYYMIGNSQYFDRPGLYGYDDDYERFAFFTKASIEFLFAIDFKPDIIHFNDWQTGLGPVYLCDIYRRYNFYENTKSLYTIHNLQYQGQFSFQVLDAVGLNYGYYTNDKLEYYSNVSYMKGGIVYADAVSTVSKTYADEIQTPAYSYGMDGVLRSRRADLFGIINGIDCVDNDPSADKRLFKTYDVNSIDDKYINKVKLKRELGLYDGDQPLIGVISRMVVQKGFDIISVAMEELMNKDIQMVVLGSGDSRYENMFRHYAWRFGGKLSANIVFNTTLAQKIYAGCDIFLMPSLFEPCGLGQMIAMRYGAVPVVRRTGGLNDTVSDYTFESKTGNGFVFNDYDAYGMMWAVNEAVRVYYDEPSHWRNIIKNAMQSDFTWARSAEEYINLYMGLKNRVFV